MNRRNAQPYFGAFFAIAAAHDLLIDDNAYEPLGAELDQDSIPGSHASDPSPRPVSVHRVIASSLEVGGPHPRRRRAHPGRAP